MGALSKVGRAAIEQRLEGLRKAHERATVSLDEAVAEQERLRTVFTEIWNDICALEADLAEGSAPPAEDAGGFVGIRAERPVVPRVPEDDDGA